VTPPLRDHVDHDLDTIRAWQIRGGLEDVAAAILRLWDERAWGLRGYDSWAAMYTAEIGEPLRLSARNRRELHRQLTDGGMSARAVAVVTGTSKDAVARDNLQTVSSRDSLEIAPATIGLDGAKRITGPDSAALTQRIVELRDEGHTFPKIAEQVGLTTTATHFRYSNHKRKQADGPPPALVQLPTAERIAELAATGVTSVQIAHDLGLHLETVRKMARRDGVRLVGDINRGRGGAKTIDMPKAITNWITHLTAALDSADAFMDLDGMDPDEAAEWTRQLDEISKRFRALTRRFQHQSNPERQAHHGRS
jgi:hypothetical protein